MKETEAKTKWCPMIRHATKSGGDWDKCIASDCMMWAWDVSPHSAAAVNARGNAGAIASGHCGLKK